MNENNNNKKKIVIGSIIGVLLLLVLIVSVVYSKGNTNKNKTEEEVVSNKVNIDSVINDVSNASTGVEVKDIVTTPKPEPVKEENIETPEPTVEPEKETEPINAEKPMQTNTETVNKETTNETVTTTDWGKEITTVTDWGTPQEYNGDPEGRGPGRIIVKGFDYNAFNDLGMAWEGEYWTASNGVEIKILSIDGSHRTGMIPVIDGKGKDIEPNSPFQVAVTEAAGDLDNINNYYAVDASIPLSSYKKSEIDINDAALVAYRDAYDYKLWNNKGVAENFTPYKQGDPINLRFAVASDGIGEYDSLGAQWWHVVRMGDYWEVKIYSNLAEFRWDGIHQVLRYLSPDGDALYNLIYEDYYYGNVEVIPEFDEWYSYNNSQVMLEDPTDDSTEAVVYRFR